MTRVLKVRYVKMQHAYSYRFSHFLRNRTLGNACNIADIPRENQFRRKRTELTAAPFHLICSTFVAESKIEKRMHGAHNDLACFSILHFSREI